MEEKKKVNGTTIVIVTLLIIVVALCGYIGYDKLVSKNITKENYTSETKEKENGKVTNEISNSTTSEEKEECESQPNKARCYGTYYVNGNKNEGVYILKEDGTYQVENQEQFGVFVIHENTITFINMKHTTGPREEDPIYNEPKSYLIYDDCSKIRLTESGSHTSAYLVKTN